MSSILILYSSTDGHTLTICRRLQKVMEQEGHQVSVVAIADRGGVELRTFDKIVIGARIRYGRHERSVLEFVAANQALLESRPSAFFSVNIVARKPEKNRPETNPYVRRFLTQTSWRPQCLEVFAGKLNYPKYRFIDRAMIRLIMRMTGGPTDPKAVVEFTDWQQVDKFGRELSAM